MGRNNRLIVIPLARRYLVPALALYGFCVAYLIFADASVRLLPDKLPHLVTLLGLAGFGLPYLRKLWSHRPLIMWACLCGWFLVLQSIVGPLLTVPVARRETMLLCGLLGGILFSTIILYLASRRLGLALLGLSLVGFVAVGAWSGTPWIFQSLWLVGPAMVTWAALALYVAKRWRGPRPQLRLQDHHITPMEFTCIKWLLAGLDTKEMADERKVTVSAINNHLCGIYQKLGVKNRAQLLYNLSQHDIVYVRTRG